MTSHHECPLLIDDIASYFNVSWPFESERKIVTVGTYTRKWIQISTGGGEAQVDHTAFAYLQRAFLLTVCALLNAAR